MVSTETPSYVYEFVPEEYRDLLKTAVETNVPLFVQWIDQKRRYFGWWKSNLTTTEGMYLNIGRGDTGTDQHIFIPWKDRIRIVVLSQSILLQNINRAFNYCDIRPLL